VADTTAQQRVMALMRDRELAPKILVAIIAQLVEAAVVAQSLHNAALTGFYRDKFYEQVERVLAMEGIR
jgi:hypothetical protein